MFERVLDTLLKRKEVGFNSYINKSIFLNIIPLGFMTFSGDIGKACNFIKKETLAQMFSCEFCEISKNTFFTEHLWTTASKSYRPKTAACSKIVSLLRLFLRFFETQKKGNWWAHIE